MRAPQSKHAFCVSDSVTGDYIYAPLFLLMHHDDCYRDEDERDADK